MKTISKSVSIIITLSVLLFNCKKENVIVSKPSATLNGINVSTFMYQIQNLDGHTSIDMLSQTNYDMLIVEPGFNMKDDPYDATYMVGNLKNKPNGSKRLLLAYIDIGQAEEWRTYWENDWIAPTDTQHGYPSFLITTDPDGWEGNYPVAYWDTIWQSIWLGNDGLINRIADYGFDGVYLDWVEAYDDDNVRDFSSSQGVNPEDEMILFIEKIKNKGKEINPNFLVISQNAPYLIDSNPNLYTSIIDAISTEDTWFYGEGDENWNSPNAGDKTGGARHAEDYSTNNRIKQNKKYVDFGIPVFTVDYCISSQNADFVYKTSRENGFIPLVTRVSLSEITEESPF